MLQKTLTHKETARPCDCAVISSEMSALLLLYELDREYDRACVKEEDKRINDKRFYNRLGERTVDDIDSSHEVKDVITGNIFEEYSKQLRNEPNKFEELMKLIKK